MGLLIASIPLQTQHTLHSHYNKKHSTLTEIKIITSHKNRHYKLTKIKLFQNFMLFLRPLLQPFFAEMLHLPRPLSGALSAKNGTFRFLSA
jgi:hypothetical protein